MKNIIDDLNDELKTLKLKERYLTKNKSNSERVHVVVRNNNGHPSYYVVNEEGREQYVPKDSLGEIKKLLQEDYDANVLKVIKKRINAITSFKKSYVKYNPKEVYQKLSYGKQLMVSPAFETDEEFVTRWKKNHRVFSQPNNVGIATKSGFLVRSKTEKFIADALFEKNIVFVYEMQLNFKSGEFLSCDFVICDSKNRRSIYWEHFGMMKDQKYRENTINKVLTYISNNLTPGDNFIWTVDNTGYFDYTQIENNINWILNGGKWNAPNLLTGKINNDAVV